MKLRFPVLVESWSKAEGGPRLTMSLWFHPEVQAEGRLQARVQSQFGDLLRQRISELQREARHEALLQLAFCPELREHRFQLNFVHRKRTVKMSALVTTFRHLGQTVGCIGKLGVYFQAPEETGSLEARTVDVLKEHFRENQIESTEASEYASKQWLTYLDVNAAGPAPYSPPPPVSVMALLGLEEERGAAEELQRVGRRLESQVRERHTRVLGRERELQELRDWLDATPRSCVLLVGPRQVGKTALLREAVRRRLHAVEGRARAEHWSVSPGRLISGMSVVGQWESRLVKVLRFLRKHNHVLVLDDLLGLLNAGISRDSNLSVAGVLKPYLERRELRVVAEITPEALHVLRQRDAGFADLFHQIAVAPSGLELGLRVALGAARHAEEWNGTTFSLEALHLIGTICQRYLRDTAFPGKAATMVRQMAARYRNQRVEAAEVLAQFQQRSGLRLEIVDDRQSFEREEILQFMGERVLGQPDAVQACADAACLAKARLQAADRPIASFLFVGPTGVGKTESARALGEFLFGEGAGLLRLDLNEYIGDDAVTRLVGSFARPQGILTEMVRRQPFCVLLLDEVEKAHPDVLQLLLQILGDGRLSDALGRTTDFSQAIIILTSNLGSTEAGRPVGLRSGDQQARELTYRRAVEAFFTPELFNRLDRIVCFQPLSRETVSRLAWHCMQKVLRRDGLQRRQCLLQVEPAALEQLTDLGFHPQLGARALKRAVEQHLTAPVAAELAALPADNPTLIVLNSALQVEVTSLLPSDLQTRPPLRSDEELGRLLARWEAELQQQNRAGVLSSEHVAQDQVAYYGLLEELRELRTRWQRARPGQRRTGRPGDKREKLPEVRWLSEAQWESLALSSDLFRDLRLLDQQMRTHPALPEELQRTSLQLEMNRWRWLAANSGADEQAALPAFSGDESELVNLRKAYAESLRRWDVRVERDTWHGPLAATFLSNELGIHLFAKDRQLRLVRFGEPRRLVRLYADAAVVDLRSGLWGDGLKALPWLLLAGLTEPRD
jgi:ATP-dependent Clp protease ATP-binding subunit ClpC